MQVKLPDGRIANFPDDMPREQIKAIIAEKFPQQAPDRQPITADTLMGLAREQFAPDPAMAPQIEGNQYASSLPGPLGQLQNSMSAQQQGMIEGVTGNFSNELTSGLMAVPDATIQAVQGNGFDLGRSFNNIYSQGQEQALGQRSLNPSLANQGTFTGALATGASLPSMMANARTPLGMMLAGGIEGAGYGAIYGAGEAEGMGRIGGALQGGAEGGVGGALLGGAVGRYQQPISQESRIIAKGLSNDRLDPNMVGARVAALGPDGMVADIGPNLQQQAASIATLPGQGSRRVIDALMDRRSGARDRIAQGLDSTLGPAPRVSQVEGEINLARKAVNSEYEPVFRAKALSDDPFVDISPVVNALDNRIKQTVGGTQSTLKSVRNLLTDADDIPIQDPQMVMAVRQELDGLIGAEQNNTIKSALSQLRKEIDTTLGNSVDGLKAVDAKFKEVAGQSDALERGGSILNDGKTAVDPADLVEEMLTMSSGQAQRLSQGARADINRIIGTKANDRVALRGIVRGDGSWNAEKLRAVFGDQKTDELLRIIDNEATMAQTENLATAGSRTQVLKAGQEDIIGKTNDPGIIREAMNFQYGNAAGKLADRLLGGVISKRREGVVNKVAEALVGKNLTPQMQTEINRLIQGMTPNERRIVEALMVSQAAQ